MAEDVFGLVGTVQSGNFRVERVVAEGGFGVVYRAQHGGFRAPVALKCLKIPDGMTSEQRDAFLEKFREEAELLFHLSANIAEVVRPLHHDVIQVGTRVVPFIVLEWLEGEPLSKLIADRALAGEAPMNLRKVHRLLTPIAHALSRAHHFSGPKGPVSIIHRDLKPDNIFVLSGSAGLRVKILDFGIARVKSVATQSAGRVTAGEALSAFTPAYGAPEQWLPKRYGQAGPWTDVWGLAITMVEALTGRPPIDGEIASMMGTAIDEKRRPTPRSEGAVVSAEVDRVFERALAVDPRNRIKDIDSFWMDLEVAMGVERSFSQKDDRRDNTQPVGMPSGAPTVRGLSEPPARAAATVQAGANEGLASEKQPAGLPTNEIASGANGIALPELELPGPKPSAAKRPAVSGAAPAKAAPKPVAPKPAPLPPSREPLGSMHEVPARGRPRIPADRIAPPSARSGLRPDDEGRPDWSELKVRLRTPIRLMLVGIALSLTELGISRFAGGEVLLAIAGVRPFHVAAVLVTIGAILFLWRFFTD